MNEAKPIRVMIVDDHDMVRRGLAVFLDTFDDMKLVGEASNGEEALRLCGEIQPDVILMDLMMPGMDGVEATRAIREAHPNVAIVALTSFQEEGLVQAVLKAGAIGYLLKNTSIDLLAETIRAASQGRPTLSPEATQALIRGATREPEPAYNLTKRELEVLGFLVQGLTNRQIAQKMNLSQSTIKFYVSSILSKLGGASRTEAVALALQHKLV